MPQLFAGRTTDGTSGKVIIDHGRPVNIIVQGDLGGGTLTVQAVTPGGAVAVEGGSFTAAGMRMIDASNFTLQVTLAGASGADLNVYVDMNPSPTL
jgi:hypothetical protein